jgi:hypothetical protein
MPPLTSEERHMQARELKNGDIVQISPELPDCFFGGCFMQITEPKSWGAQGFIAIPGERGTAPGRAFLRCKWADMEFIGHAVWVSCDKEECEVLGK